MFTKLKVMVSCCHCKKVQRLLIENRIGRDADGMDIWPCTECKKKYKLDLQNYMEESDKSFWKKKDPIKTHPADKDFSNEPLLSGKKDKNEEKVLTAAKAAAGKLIPYFKPLLRKGTLEKSNVFYDESLLFFLKGFTGIYGKEHKVEKPIDFDMILVHILQFIFGDKSDVGVKMYQKIKKLYEAGRPNKKDMLDLDKGIYAAIDSLQGNQNKIKVFLESLKI